MVTEEKIERPIYSLQGHVHYAGLRTVNSKGKGFLDQSYAEGLKKEKGMKDVKVIDRFLTVNNQIYTVENIPDYLK